MLKRAIALKQLLIFLIDAEIRIEKLDFFQLGESTATDDIVECVSRQLTHRTPHPDLAQIESSNQLAISELKAIALTHEQTRTALKHYFLAQSYIEAAVKNSVEASRFLALARAIDASVDVPSDADINVIFKLVKKRLKLVRSALAERSAIKLDFRLSDLPAVAGIISAIFVVSGYLYTKYFFAAFGVDSTLFFSVGDYLAASLEQIREGAFAAVLGLCSMLLGIRDESMKPRQFLKAIQPRKMRERKFFLVLTVVILGTCIWTLTEEKPNFNVLYLGITLGSMWLATAIGEAFFERRLLAVASLATLFIFALTVALSGYKHVYEIKSSDSKKQFVHIKFKEKLFPEQNKSRVISINSQYVFLLIENQSQVFIVPREKIEFAVTANPKH